ncbi:MAG: RnfH family protein [Arsenophonus sp.]|nr:MAG: RnfH family protein [Arsenophonus sp.]
MIKIEVVYALPKKQFIIQTILPKNSTVKTAIIKSKILKIRKEIKLNKNKIGIYGKIVKLNDIIFEGDRIEIYRSLTFLSKLRSKL